MSQILHILRKDVRHHWPEILASLALLAMYTWHEPDTWSPLRTYGPGFEEFIWGILPGLVSISWCFLILRSVLEETLVGDRQFWVTRPYDWYKLLAAKVVFLVAFVNLPLFVVDVILLHAGGYSVASNIAGLLGLQASMTFVVFLPVTTGSTVTRSIGEFLLLVLAVVLCLVGFGAVVQAVPNAGMPTGMFPGAPIMILFFATCVVVVIWQYMHRRVWQSRTALVGMVLAVLLILVATPYRLLIAREYPVAENGKPALARFAFDAEAPHSSQFKLVSPQQRVVDVRLPLRTSGIKEDLVAVRGIFVQIDGADGFRTDSNWQSEFSLLRPSQEHWEANFGLEKKTFGRIKSTPVNLRISLALTGYHEENRRTIIATTDKFTVPEVGRCAILRPEAPLLQCLAALKNPVFFATIDRTRVTCGADIMKDWPTSAVFATQGDWDDDSEFVPPGISPIIAFSPYFLTESASQRPNSVSICSGTAITFSRPRPFENSHAELEIDRIRLEDYLPRPVDTQ